MDQKSPRNSCGAFEPAGVVQSLPQSIIFYNSLMPTIRVTIVSPSPGFYNFLFADANNDSIRKGFHGTPEARLLRLLSKICVARQDRQIQTLRERLQKQGRRKSETSWKHDSSSGE